MTLNALDLIIILILGIVTVWSGIKGFFKTIINLAAIILGYIVASHFYVFLVEMFREKMGDSVFIKGLCFIVLFVISAGVILILGHFCNKFIKKSPLRGIDHVGGVLFGFIKGACIVGVLLVFLVVLLPKDSKFTGESRILPKAKTAFLAMKSLLPQSLKKKTTQKYEEFKNYWKQTKENLSLL
ncbi:MAG: CvpA family protein [bacterium]